MCAQQGEKDRERQGAREREKEAFSELNRHFWFCYIIDIFYHDTKVNLFIQVLCC